MRVLMVSPSFFPILGGTETYVAQLTEKLNQRGIEADVMTFNMDSKWNPVGRDEIRHYDGFQVFRISAHKPHTLNFHGHDFYSELLNTHVIPRSGFASKFENYDIIHFHDDSDFSFPLFSYLTQGKSGPRLLHFHTIPYTYKRYKRSIILGTLLKKSADLYLGLSAYTMQFLSDLGLPKSKSAIIPNAINTDMFKPSEHLRTDNLILFVGRIIPEKGLDILLKALFKVETQTRLAIVGPVGDDAFFSGIEDLIFKINKTTVHKVNYMGPLRGSALIKWYQTAAIFAAPARSDHFPIANLEALACSTPVIATPIGAIPDVVKDRVNGLLVPPNDPLALASALNTLLENKKLRESYGRKGKEIVEEHFSWNVVVEKVIRIYNQLLNARHYKN